MKENENKSQTSIGESCIGCRLFFFFFVLSFYFRSCLAPTHLRNLLGAKHGAHMLFLWPRWDGKRVAKCWGMSNIDVEVEI